VVTVEDPFAHLHDEDYAHVFDRGFVGHQTLVQGGGRSVQPLNEGWRLTLDLFDEGLRQRWYADDECPPSQWAVPRDYEIEAGKKVSVPSCWNMLQPEWRYFEGAAWYTRALHCEHAPDGERLILQVGAAASSALIFLNGRFLGGHRGASTPFSIELTDALIPGPNRLQIMVENRRKRDGVPMHHFDWFNYGGLYREVSLMKLPAVFVRGVRIGLVPNSEGARIFIEVEASHPVTEIATLHCSELWDHPQDIPLHGGNGRVEFEATPKLWSLATPKLYDIEVRLDRDIWTDRVGFREITTKGTELFLNGEPLFLKGVCVHEDDVDLGKVSTLVDTRRRIADIKALGANFMRLSHYPHHEQVARLCDEAGILLWAEVPVYWAIDFGNPSTLADAENQLLELIKRDCNRASIIMWGVGNENADTEARYRFMRHLAEAARAADKTRLITAACLIDREKFAIVDRLTEHLDVIGLNEYFGWYEPDMSGLKRLIANSGPEKPVIISETGADALAGHRGSGRVLFSEDWQACFYQQQWEIITATPWIVGLAAWILYDFRSERRQTGFQRGFNRKGLISEDKATRKQAFHALADMFRSHR
jgi:beta-glucuronidase